MRTHRIGLLAAVVIICCMSSSYPVAAEEPTAETPSIERARDLLDQEQHAEAEAMAREVLAGAGEDARAVEALEVLVEALRLMGRADDSETQGLARRTVSIRERIFGSESIQVADSLDMLGNVLLDAGDYAGANEAYQRASSIRESVLEPDHVDIGTSLLNIGTLLATTGDLPAARTSFERALSIWETSLDTMHIDLARVLNNLGNIELALGAYDKARVYYERTLPISAHNSAKMFTAYTLNGLGVLEWLLGDYAAALSYYEQTLAIEEELYGSTHPSVAQSRHNIAGLYHVTGDYETARRQYEKALEIRESIDPEHPDVANMLNGLALLFVDLNEHERARLLLERALAIQAQTLPDFHPDMATTKNNLGHILLLEGSDTEAAQLLESALAVREQIFGDQHPAVADSLHELAALQRGRSVEDAQGVFERALEIRRNALGRDHPIVADALLGLAEVQAVRGDPTALDSALLAEEVSRNHFRLTARSLTEQQGLRYAEIRASGLDLALSLAVENPDSAIRDRVWNAVVRSRALVLDEIAARVRAVQSAVDHETRERLNRYQSAAARLARLRFRDLAFQTPEQYNQLVSDALAEKEQAERELAETSKEFARGLNQSQLGLDEVIDSLPADCGLVAYVLYDRHDLSSASAAASAQARVPSYLAFVLGPDKEPSEIVPIGPAERVDREVAEWRRHFGEDSSDESQYRQAAATLRRSVWDPLVEHLGQPERVFVVPDGALNLVSFATLPVDESGYLIEYGPVVHYLSTERDLPAYSEMLPTSSGALVVGGPNYDDFVVARRATPQGPPDDVADTNAGVLSGEASGRTRSVSRRSNCSDAESAAFPPLPSAAKEAREIAARLTRRDRVQWTVLGGILLAAAFALAGVVVGRKPTWRRHLVLALFGAVLGAVVGYAIAPKLSNTELFIGSRASEDMFKSEASSRRILHLATHGFFFGECDKSVTSGSRAAGSGLWESPLLHSGLVLAGANHREAAGPGQEDGMLTAEEVAALDLSGTEWAVLSACDTGLGEYRGGEGVLGLRRAFHVAGARTLLMSLWSVDDESARLWMNYLYRGRLEEDLDTAAAVQKASLRMLQDRRRSELDTHPFYWGGFVAEGDWR